MLQRFAVILLLSLSSIQCSAVESGLRTPTSTYTRPSNQRRELGLSNWWDILYNKVSGSSSKKCSKSQSGCSTDGYGVDADATESEVEQGDEASDESYIASSEMTAEDGSTSSSMNASSDRPKSVSNAVVFVFFALVAAAVGTAFYIRKVRRRSILSLPCYFVLLFLLGSYRLNMSRQFCFPSFCTSRR